MSRYRSEVRNVQTQGDPSLSLDKNCMIAKEQLPRGTINSPASPMVEYVLLLQESHQATV